jgi:hypothetical protein
MFRPFTEPIQSFVANHWRTRQTTPVAANRQTRTFSSGHQGPFFVRILTKARQIRGLLGRFPPPTPIPTAVNRACRKIGHLDPGRLLLLLFCSSKNLPSCKGGVSFNRSWRGAQLPKPSGLSFEWTLLAVHTCGTERHSLIR